MEISVDLTYSPLQDDYEAHIIAFIKRLRNSGLIVQENALATQVYGEYDAVMSVLHREIKRSLEEVEVGLFYIKLVKTNRADYVSNF